MKQQYSLKLKPKPKPKKSRVTSMSKPIEIYKAKRYSYNGEFHSPIITSFNLYRRGDIHEYRLNTDRKQRDLTELVLHDSGKAFIRNINSKTQLIKLHNDNLQYILQLLNIDRQNIERNYTDIQNMIQQIDIE